LPATAIPGIIVDISFTSCVTFGKLTLIL